ncbi:MAG: hypothetical protein H0T68_00920 [Gemmatimonadales bacterium]|nr:hypothetical protein [Gemmatimonadales bacterium]
MGRNSGVVDVELVKPPLWKRAIPVLLLLALGATIWYFITTTGQTTEPDVVAEATDVRSEVTREGDSLEVTVGWDLTTASAQSVPESIRVEIGLSDSELASVSTQPADRQADTLRIPTPDPGGTASGYSCVSAIHRGRLMKESCTPWQFVLPSAEQAADSIAAPPAPRRQSQRDTAGSPVQVSRIVVQPSGLQVDPDIDGRCAAWQKQNPGRPVWIEVNQKAVAECTGPNGKPTVAQFCAFAVLADGRRIQTQNSGNPYCARLFKEWSAERVS